MKTRITSLFLTLAMLFSLAVPALAEDLPATEEILSAEPVYEAPVYEELPAAETPVYEELPAAETPVYEELPATETPVYEELPTAEDSASTVTAEEPVYTEEPVQEEPAAEESTFVENVPSEETPAAVEESLNVADPSGSVPEASAAIPADADAEPLVEDPSYEEALPVEEVSEAPEPLEEEQNVDEVAAFEASGSVRIIASNFPDAEFRSFIMKNYDTNSDTNLSASEIAAVTYIDCQNQGISDLSGILYFTSMTRLYCNNNQIKNLNLSGKTNLLSVRCDNNGMESLNLCGCTSLEGVACYQNQLSALYISDCSALVALQCNFNALTDLNLTSCVNLQSLWCNSNQLRSLDLSANSKIKEIQNNITSLGAGIKGFRYDADGDGYYDGINDRALVVDNGVSLIFSDNIPSGDIGPCSILYSGGSIGFDHDLTYYVSNAVSTQYNQPLAKMLIALSSSAYNKAFLKQSLLNMNFSVQDDDFHNYSGYENGSDSVAYSFAMKPADDGTTIIAVIIRGTASTQEWESNLNIRVTGGFHPGFYAAATDIQNALNRYIAYNDTVYNAFINGQIKLIITGHSRGAAVGNLFAKMLVDNSTLSANQIFAYNFACPDTVVCNPTDLNPGGKYNCIFNISNVCDLVAVVPGGLGTALNEIINTQLPNNLPQNLIWGKYGQTYYYSTNWSSFDTVAVHGLVDVWNIHPSEIYVSHIGGSYGQFSNFKSWEDSRIILAKLTPSGIIKGRFLLCLCPTDVIVKDETGQIIVSVIDTVPDYHGSQFPEVMILVAGDEKYIYVEGDRDLTVELTGTDEGEMQYCVFPVNEGLIINEEGKVFDNVTLEPGKEMLSPISAGQAVETVPLYILNETGEKVLEVNVDGTEIPYEEPLQMFPDVSDPSRYFYEPVYWALQNNITKGYGQDDFGRDLFSPDAPCTREQIVTFLWRLMGEPEPLNYDRSFTDVPSDKWYYKPIMWAASTGITTGYADGSGRFGIGDPCTREQCVTFLWRAAGKPAPASYSAFTDVPSDSYYYDSVSWAASNNITVGLNDGTGRFGVGMTCSRAMIVTFLYRYNNMR